MELNNAVKGKINVEVNGAKDAFDQFPTIGSDSYYSPCRVQNDFSGDSGLSQIFTPSFSSDEELPLSFNSWPSQDDSYQLMNCAQGISKKRNFTDGNDCGSETDLFGLVSTILDEVNPADSYFSQEISSGLKTVWSPKSMKEDSLHYLNSEANMQSGSGMQSNHLCPESVGRDSNHSTDIYQHFNGFDVTDPTWLFSTCSGDSEARPPPGLSIPPVVSTYLSKSRAGNFEHKDDSFCSTSDAISENMDAFNDPCSLPNKVNESYFTPYQDFSALNRPKMKNSRPFSVQDGNKLVSNIQALLMEGQGDFSKSELVQNSPKRTQEEHMVDMRSFSFQNISAISSHMPGRKREMTGSVREQRGADVGKSQPLQSNYTTKGFSGFSQASDYFEPLKSFLSPFNPATPDQGKEVSQAETTALQNSLHQYHHIKSNQYQSQAKLPTKTSIKNDHQGISKLMSHSVAEFVPLLSSQERPTARAFPDFGQSSGVNLQGRIRQTGLGLGLDGLRNPAGGGDGGDFCMNLDHFSLQAPATSERCSSQQFGVKFKPPASFSREADQQQGLLQNPYEMLASMYTNQTRHVGTGPSQAKPVPFPLFPYMSQMGDPQQNSCHAFPSHSPLDYGASAPPVDISELLADGTFPALNPFLQELMKPNLAGGDGPIPGLLSTMRSPKLSKCHGTPMSQLHHYLEECYEQWRMLEKERKKTEAVLGKSYPGKRGSVTSNNPLPKMPPNPSRVDRLVVDQLREQAKVVNLLGKMECLRSFPFHANICSALDRHLDAIYFAQARRKDEFLNSGSKQRQGSAYVREDRDPEILLLSSALKDLSCSTRKSRTVLWCALQMTLPKISASSKDGGEGDACSPIGLTPPWPNHLRE